MNNKQKFLIGAFTLSMLMLVFSSCGKSEVEEVQAPTVTTADIDNKKVIDNPLIYAKDDPFTVETMYLTVRKGNESDGTDHTWEEINAHSTYFYDENDIDRYKIEATLQVGDETGPVPDKLGYSAISPNATVQIRGKTTSRSEQKSYQIKVKKGKGEWNEQRTIILNKHIFDVSRFANKMGYDVMSQYPELLGLRTKFIHLYVKDLSENGEETFVDYGLYTQVEQPNKRYMKTHGLDENGQLYKASMFEFLPYDALKLKTDEAYDQKAFEEILEIKGNDDHKKLIAMLDDINNFAIPIEDSFNKYFDSENYFSWLAFQLIVGNKDIISQNFYLYSPQNGTKWYFIAWDNDDAWSHRADIEKNYTQGYDYTQGLSNLWGVTLHQRVLRSPDLKKSLLEKIEYFHKEITQTKIQSMVEKYSQIVFPYLYAMPDMNYAVAKKENYFNTVNQMSSEMEYNYQMILESLKHPMPFYYNEPQVTGEKLVYVWENSFDYNNEALTYNLQIAKDYDFKNIVFEQKDLPLPQAEGAMLPDGQYFMRITAKNTSGQTQSAMVFYEDVNGLIHRGVSTFFVQNNEVLGG